MNLSAIDLNLLWTLHAVLEEKSVAGAAARLHVTPPAISNGLARLRDVLGDPLFVRRGRGLVPTPKALELGAVLARSFAEISRTLDGGQAFDAKTCTRELTLALSDADQIASLPAISRLFLRRLPRAKLRIVSLDTLMAEGGLAGETVDLAVGPPSREPDLHQARAYEEVGVYIARKGHPRVKRKLSATQFNSEGHVDLHLLLGRAGTGNRMVEEALARAGLKRNILATVPTFFAAANLVANTDLLTGLPLRVAHALRRALPIEILDGPAAPLRFELFLQWHERTHRDPAVAVFREVALEALRTARR